MKTIIAVLIVLLIVPFAQAQQRWARTYGGTGTDLGQSVQQTLDGGYVVTGYTNSFGNDIQVYLIKTNAYGDTAWTRTFGGNDDDRGYCVQQTLDEGYIVAGLTYTFGPGTPDHCNVYLVKTDAAGDTLWTRAYGGVYDDEAYSVEQTPDGDHIVAGSTSSFGAGGGDVYLLKLDGSGDTLWTRTYGGTGDEQGNSVQQTFDGGYVVAGYANSFGAGSYDVYLVKTDAAGDTQWTRTYGGTGIDVANSVQQTSDSGYIIVGYSNSFGAHNNLVYLIKTNAAGDTVWTRTYGGAGNENIANSVRQTPDGGYIVAGYTNSFGAGNYDVYLIKTDAAGDTIWTRTYGGADVDEGECVRPTTDGGYIIAGETNSYGAGNGDVYLIKTDVSGYAGVNESVSSEQRAGSRVTADPNPFASFTRIPGREGERFDIFDVSGKKVGTYWGSRIGQGLSPSAYFIRLNDKQGMNLRIVKVK
jgi:hypothetical protein